MGVKIRPVSRKDKDEWCRMRTRIWPESPDDHPAEIAAYFDDPADDFTVLVAERRDGGLCGFIEVGTRAYAEGCETSPVAYIEGWWVDADLRRQGVGAALVRAAEDWARSIGMTEIASDTVIANRVSLAAHTALGYREEDRLICFRKAL